MSAGTHDKTMIGEVAEFIDTNPKLKGVDIDARAFYNQMIGEINSRTNYEKITQSKEELIKRKSMRHSDFVSFINGLINLKRFDSICTSIKDELKGEGTFSERQKISKELLKKSNELNTTNIRIAELNEKENELKNTNNALIKQIEVYEKNIQDLKNKELISRQNLIDTKKLYTNTTIEYISYESKITDLFDDRNVSNIFKIKNINNIDQDLKKSLILPIDRVKQQLNKLYEYLGNAKSSSEKDNYQSIIKTYSSNMKKFQEILHIQEPDYKLWKDSFLKAVETKQKFVNICKKDYEKEFIEINIKNSNWNDNDLKYMQESGEITKTVEKHSDCERRINFNIEYFFFKKWLKNQGIVSDIGFDILDLVYGKIDIKQLKSRELLSPPSEADIEKYILDIYKIK